MQVDSVVFNPLCLATGCWTIEVTFTAGIDDFNVFRVYLPKAEASDSLSYDFDYTALDSSLTCGQWPKSAADTFFPANHPCTSKGYDPSSGTLPATVTACCLPEFLEMFRP
eukprot:597372-Rhodomonas_salina.2